MCGITAGAYQKADIKQTVLRKKKKLEYRGYDSAGIAALCTKKKLHVMHNTDSIKQLTNSASSMPSSQITIGHTRWATHGEVNIQNAHPHTAGGRVALVHNGIIENHQELKSQFSKEAIEWKSTTDSEVIVQLIYQALQSGLTIESAILTTTTKLKGTYALAIIDRESPDKVYCIAHKSSLILGRSDQESFICSDQSALLDICNQACQAPNGILFTVSATKITASAADCNLNWQPLAVPRPAQEKSSTYETVTHKEIMEQPGVLQSLVDKHISKDNTITNLPNGLAESLKKHKRIQIIACGSSYFSALVGKYWIESFAEVPVSVDLASEYHYRSPIIEPDTFLITLSQSGETLDTISAQRYLAQRQPATESLSIGNNTLSTLALESTFFWPTLAGPEVGVATTKVFSAQLFCLISLCAQLCRNKKRQKSLIQAISTLPLWASEVLTNQLSIKKQAQKHKNDHAMIFCARGENYPIAQEAALKLKELAYVHASAYATGELKHGPLALVDEQLTSVFFVNNDNFLEKTKSNISEVLARKGQILIIGAKDALVQFTAHGKRVQLVPTVETSPPAELSPFTNVIGAQLLTYHIAKSKNCSIDKPRNLAKCVTVE